VVYRRCYMYPWIHSQKRDARFCFLRSQRDGVEIVYDEIQVPLLRRFGKGLVYPLCVVLDGRRRTCANDSRDFFDRREEFFEGKVGSERAGHDDVADFGAVLFCESVKYLSLRADSVKKKVETFVELEQEPRE